MIKVSINCQPILYLDGVHKDIICLLTNQQFVSAVYTNRKVLQSSLLLLYDKESLLALIDPTKPPMESRR